jgi:hypothetical protein
VSAVDVLAAMTRIRIAAEGHMDDRDLAGLGWTEETVTEVCIHQGFPEVKVVQFNPRQEGGGVGADYLWWWLAPDTGECFGMLVQAKPLYRQGCRWAVDIRYRKGKQLRDLLRAAHFLQVPAMYGIYTGGQIHRQSLPCFHGREPLGCLSCRRMAISLIGAYQVDRAWASPVDVGSLVLNRSIPLEDLVDPALPAGKVFDLNLPKLKRGPLRDFLITDQQGPREVAKRIFKAVAADRLGAFSATTAEPLTITGDQIFPVVPQDRGHYRAPYYEHFLGGLRTRAPSYIYDALQGRELPGEISKLVDGVIVVTLPVMDT